MAVMGDPFFDEVLRRPGRWSGAGAPPGTRPAAPLFTPGFAPPVAPSMFAGGGGGGANVAGPTGPVPPGAFNATGPSPPAMSPHLNPAYVGWGTPGLEWYGPTAPTSGQWKGDRGIAGQQIWRSDWDPRRPGYILGET